MNQAVEVFDVYDYFYTPLWHQQWFIVMLVLGSLLGVGFIVVYFVRRSRKKELSLYEQSLAQLEQLSHEDHKPKEFYYLLTTILKEYLSSMYSLNLQSKTDFEVIKMIKQQGVSAPIVELIEQMLLGMVTIKFANKKAEQEQMHQDLKRCTKAIKFINYKKQLDTSDTL